MADALLDPPSAAAPPTAAAAPSEAVANPASAAPASPAVEAAPVVAAAPELKPHTEEPGLLTQALKELDAKNAPKAPEKAPEAAPDPAKPAEPAKVETKPEDKPADAPKTEGEVDPPAADPAAPFEYKYTLPETLKLDEPMTARVHEAFDAFRANPAEGAQKLIDLYHEQTQAFAVEHAKSEAQRHHDAFRDLRREWSKEIMADEQLGGSGFQTTKAAAARMRDRLVRPAFLAERKWDDGSPRASRFEEFIESTGAADNIVMWDMLHNAARLFDEPAMPPANPKPAPGNGARPVTRLRDTYAPRQT